MENVNGQSAPANNQIAIQEKTIADSVMNKIKVFEETGTLNIPKDYSAPNAIRAAWLVLLETKNASKQPVLEVCTRESIANALLRMIIQGLNPVKKQCSFIAYGNQLVCQREYQGTIAIAKRDAGLEKIFGVAVFKDDEFEYSIEPQTGNKVITKHIQTLESMSGEVKGAYAIKKYTDGTLQTEIMSMSQIVQAWKQGPTKGDSPAHRNFPDQMAIKTVINRALKIDINSSDDSALLDDGTPEGDDVKMADVKHRISENANKQVMSFDAPESESPNMKVDVETGELQEQLESEQQMPGPGF